MKKTALKVAFALIIGLGIVSCTAQESGNIIQDNDRWKPVIGDNGNWFVGGVDTGVQAEGKDGTSVNIVDTKTVILDGRTYEQVTFSDGTVIKIPHDVDGKDGLTPYIGSNGNWFIGEIDTGVQVEGKDGKDGNSITIISKSEIIINEQKYLEICFSDGTNIRIPYGQDGLDGFTPYIKNGEWYINGVSTGVKAAGDNVEMRLNGTIIEWKSSSSNVWNTLLDISILKGNDGLNGQSAYEIYKKYCDYEGTEEEWIKELVNGTLNFKDPGIIDYIAPYRIRVAVGEAVSLPNRINAFYSSGVIEEVNVTWNKDTINTNYVGEKKILGIVENYQEKVECFVRVVNYDTSSKYVDGYVNGLLSDDSATVTLFNDSYMETLTPSSTGYYKFENLNDGEYTIKVDANGYEAIDISTASISSVTKDKNTIYSNIEHVNFNIKSLREKGYYFTYQLSEKGYAVQTASLINETPQVSFLNPTMSNLVSDIGAASILREKYNVVLMNTGVTWSNETTSRFLELYSSIPTNITQDLKSIWKLTNDYIKDDIMFELVDDHYEVTLCIKAISYATPRTASIDGKAVKYFSNRLYNAMIRFVTNNGFNAEKCEQILNENFLCSFNVPDYNYLTEGITDEGPEKFQEFLPDEKINILTMFEEMPEGLHKIKELKYLIRRKTGQSHPIYPTAAAVTWTRAKEPYIEFMDSAFNDNLGYYDTKRLIIHEKMHMFYEYYFSSELKEEWQKIGGWYINPNDPDGWSTTKETEFVSAYAHLKNPDEDMAESAATYIINPELLKNRSIDKYKFIQNYVMNGTAYKISTREDLQFEVYNLSPDYIYPGKIKSLTVKVTGDLYDYKTLTLNVKLFGNDKKYGATGLYTRIIPSDTTTNQFYDLMGCEVDSLGLELQGSINISKYAYNGYWFSDQIRLTDAVGNERFLDGIKYGMKVYVDNPLADLEKPKIVPNSMKLELRNANNPEHPNEQILRISVKGTDNLGIESGSFRLVCLFKNKESIDLQNLVIDNETGLIYCDVIIPEHYSTGEYEVTEVSLIDFGKNNYFEHTCYGGLQGQNNRIYIKTANPDNKGPELNLNDITISAVPSNPEAPNGETYVTLKLKIKDDISGLSIGYIKLLDPQGKLHGYWLYTPRYNVNYFEGDPTIETEYTFKFTLPEGSAPGTWGIYEISLTDCALNSSVYDFTEIIHFEIIK